MTTACRVFEQMGENSLNQTSLTDITMSLKKLRKLVDLLLLIILYDYVVTRSCEVFY